MPPNDCSVVQPKQIHFKLIGLITSAIKYIM